jgi:dTDP-4-dehydrorhamnose reductase
MILVFGKSGQVATELALQGADPCLSRAQADFETPGAVADAIAAHRPRAVINAVAYTAVDRAEDDSARAFRINEGAVSEMAQACATAGIPLVHLSTDYVFDGSGTAPWQVTDAPAPLNVYGRSKRAGEDTVRAAGGTHAIVRTSWVVSAHGNNFVKTMLRLGREKDTLSIVADQTGAPTSARDIATACLEIAGQLLRDPSKSGTYHYQSRPFASWADVACAVFAQAGLPCSVTDIPTSAYPTPAARPLNSRLDCTATQEVLGLAMPDWRDAIETIVGELT